MNDTDLVLRMILELYPDEELSAQILSFRIKVGKSQINSCLYRNQGQAFFVSKRVGERPFWSNTKEANRLYKEIYEQTSFDNSKHKIPLCHVCNDLLVRSYCTSPGCSENPQPPDSTYVPQDVRSGNEGLPGWFGINFRGGTPEEKIKETIKAFICTEFWTPHNARNHSYVKSYGDPGSKKRVQKLINHFGGINVPSPLDIQKRRNKIIKWLSGLNLDFCVE